MDERTFMKHTITVPIEFKVQFDEEWALGMTKGAIDISLKYRIERTISEVMQALGSDDFRSKLVTACWAKIHDPR